jgi:4-carboxymuconolactone decarboxylase
MADNVPADAGDAEHGAAHAAGMRVRRKVLGDKHVDAAISKTDSFTADFQDLITRYAWGEIWTRPGLDEPVRRYLTIAMLACLGRDEELAMHVRAAAEGGVGADEIKEVLLQVAIYGGVPAANRAFAIAQQVFRDRGGDAGH